MNISQINLRKFKYVERNQSDFNFLSGDYIYFLIDKIHEIVYVGQSHNINLRLISHKNSEKDFNYFLVRKITTINKTKLESHFIFHCAPKYNKNLPVNDRYQPFDSIFKASYLNGKYFSIKFIYNKAYIDTKGLFIVLQSKFGCNQFTINSEKICSIKEEYIFRKQEIKRNIRNGKLKT